MNRVDALRRLFSKDDFGAYLILNPVNMVYSSGLSGASALFISIEDTTLYVYDVNYEQAKAEAKNVSVELVGGNENLLAKIAAHAENRRIKNLAADELSFESWRFLSKEFEGKIKLEVNRGYVSGLRAVKDSQEIEFMRKAGELTSEGMNAAVETIKAGVREFEVAAEIEYAMRKRGSGSTAFETIVASGVSSAFPHGGCSGRQIREGDLVVVDVGATYNNYCSDMSRTFVAGKPTTKQKRIYETVREAQEHTFREIEAGTRTADLDSAARCVIERSGYGEFFVHRLGHGVGLEVHELPTLSPNSKDTLEANNVVTVEPGIYLPGYGGVRIEDTVLVDMGGFSKFTLGAYSLQTKL